MIQDVPKKVKFTLGGVHNRTTENRKQGMIVTSFQDILFYGKQIS